MEFTSRVRISTGLKCNIRCVFCYYNEELNSQDYTTAQIKRMLDLASEYHIKDIDFSGGEPTIRKDFPELVGYASHLGFRTICVITNGTRIGEMAYLRRLVDAGLNEVLLSVHGHDHETHDALVGSKGAFKKIRSTLRNINALKLRLRVNTVVNRHNHKHLDALSEFIKPFSPAAYNLICFNDWVNASSLTENIAIKYSEVAENLNDCVDRLDRYIPKVTVRYIPFCFMKGHEKHVCGLLQNDYDHDEWIDSVKRLVTDLDTDRKQKYFDSLNQIYHHHRNDLPDILTSEEMVVMDRIAGDRPFDQFASPLAIIAHKIENYAKRQSYVKGPDCQRCSRNLICDGLEKTYADVFSTTELTPVSGDPITDPMFFRKAYLFGH